MTDEVEWWMAGGARCSGRAALTAALDLALLGGPPVKITVEHVVTHVRAGAVDGTLEFPDGPVQPFCNVFAFSSVRGTRISRITSYRSDR